MNTNSFFAAFGSSSDPSGTTGSGTSNYLARWTGSSTLGDSIIRDDGANLGINTAPNSANVLRILSDDTDIEEVLNIFHTTTPTTQNATGITVGVSGSTTGTNIGITSTSDTSTASDNVGLEGRTIDGSTNVSVAAGNNESAYGSSFLGYFDVSLDTVAFAGQGSQAGIVLIAKNGSVHDQFGAIARTEYSGNSTITNASAFYSDGVHKTVASGTITNAHGLYISANDAGTGTITNPYGIYQSGTSDVNYFAGRVDIINAMRIPYSATPTMAVDGDFAIDTTVTDFSAGVLKYYDGEEMGVVSMPIAQFSSPTDGYIISYNATNDEFELVSGGGGATTIENTASLVSSNTTIGTANYAVALGNTAGNTSNGNNTVSIGHQAGMNNNSAYCVWLGSEAGRNSGSAGTTSATDSIGVGYRAAYSLTTGSQTVAVGGLCLDTVTTSAGNVGMGYKAGRIATGAYNIFIGWEAGNDTTSASNQIIIGKSVQAASATASDYMNIGNLLKGDQSAGELYLACPASAAADGDLSNNEFTVWVDESGNNLTFKVKYSTGTVKSGTVALT